MIYYKLDKEIPGERILQDVRRLLNKYINDTKEDLVLVIGVQKITNYAGDNPLPKITYEEKS